MIDSIHIYSADNETHIVLALGPSGSNPYVVQNVYGLDLDEVTYMHYGSEDGGENSFYEPTITKRDVVILMGLRPGVETTYSALRADLYRLVSSARSAGVRIEFRSGNTVVSYLAGVVAKVEAPLFSKKQEAQLTVDCSADPMFRAPARTGINTSTLSPTLPIIEVPDATASCGLRFHASFIQNVDSFRMGDVADTWFFEIDLEAFGGFNIGDELYVDGDKSNRYAWIIRAGDQILLTDSLVADSVWPMLFPGTNELTVSAGIAWVSASYLKSYWGL